LTALALCVPALGDAEPRGSSSPDAANPASCEAWVDVVRGLAGEIAWGASDDFFHMADYPATFYSLLAVIDVDPHDPDAYICSGVMAGSMGSDEAGLRYRELGIEYTPDQFDVFHDLGMWYYERGEYKKARDLFEEAAKRPCPPFVWKMWAHACEETGELQKALDLWDKVRQLTPNDPVIDLNVKRIKKALAEGGQSSG
jgi:tetratricopeptide (TPR) repeat protein